MTVKIKSDKTIWMIVLFFAMISIVGVYSSSSWLVLKNPGVSKTAIFFEQLRSVAIGFVALYICYRIPLGWYRGLAYIIFGGSLLMLIMLMIPQFQDVRNGAVRGLKVGSHTFQVFEFVKVAFVLFLAKVIEQYGDRIETFKDFVLKILIWVVLVCLLVMQNSFSTAILLGAISILLMFFMQVKLKYIGYTIGLAVAAVLLLFGAYHFVSATFSESKKSEILGKGIFNRVGTVESRILHFAAEDVPEEQMTKAQLDRKLDEERQSENAKIAISEGRFLGRGPGRGTQRFSLSMAFSDFIYASLVEEYGLAMGLFIIFLYLVFLFRSIMIANQCTAKFSAAVTLGLAFLITMQAFLHILVNVRLLPITGHTLPLISHGGTAYMMLSAAFGIILSVSRTLEKQRLDQEEAVAAEADEETETKEISRYENEDYN